MMPYSNGRCALHSFNISGRINESRPGVQKLFNLAQVLIATHLSHRTDRRWTNGKILYGPANSAALLFILRDGDSVGDGISKILVLSVSISWAVSKKNP